MEYLAQLVGTAPESLVVGRIGVVLVYRPKPLRVAQVNSRFSRDWRLDESPVDAAGGRRLLHVEAPPQLP